MQDLTITLVQADLSWENKQSNFITFEKVFSSLEDITDVIILPEMFSTGFITEPKNLAENMEGETMNWMKQQAKMFNVVIAGSLVVIENGKYYNRFVWMKPDGTYEYYDKRHLFHPGNEHLQFSQGETRKIVEIKGWKVCLQVCYDLRFPVWSKNRFVDGKYEYDLLVYIANWPAVRSYPYRQLLIARAIENQCYVAAVNRVGTDGKGTNHQGESTVIDFKGKHITELEANTESHQTITLRYEDLKTFRDSFTVGMDWDKFEISL